MDVVPFKAGILLNAFATGVVSITAFALLLFLLGRWARLTAALRAYAWFWGFTGAIWLGVATRYLLIVTTTPPAPLLLAIELFIQSMVFGSAIALYSYLGKRLFASRQAVRFSLLFIVILGSVLAIGRLLLPGGFSPIKITSFSAEPTPHIFALTIFSVLAGLALLLLAYHSYRALQQATEQSKRSAFYSLLLICYIVVGSVDQINFATEWVLVVFRIFYTAVFLGVYLILAEDEAAEADTTLLEPAESS